MAKNWVVRSIGTTTYFGRYAPVGTNLKHATRMTKQEASEYVERSELRNKGKTKVEAVNV